MAETLQLSTQNSRYNAHHSAPQSRREGEKSNKETFESTNKKPTTTGKNSIASLPSNRSIEYSKKPAIFIIGEKMIDGIKKIYKLQRLTCKHTAYLLQLRREHYQNISCSEEIVLVLKELFQCSSEIVENAQWVFCLMTYLPLYPPYNTEGDSTHLLNTSPALLNVHPPLLRSNEWYHAICKKKCSKKFAARYAQMASALLDITHAINGMTRSLCCEWQNIKYFLPNRKNDFYPISLAKELGLQFYKIKEVSDMIYWMTDNLLDRCKNFYTTPQNSHDDLVQLLLILKQQMVSFTPPKNRHADYRDRSFTHPLSYDLAMYHCNNW